VISNSVTVSSVCLPDFIGPLTLSRLEKARPVRTCELGGSAQGPWVAADRDCTGEHLMDKSTAL
jgi:hypothetical protein